MSVILGNGGLLGEYKTTAYKDEYWQYVNHPKACKNIKQFRRILFLNDKSIDDYRADVKRIAEIRQRCMKRLRQTAAIDKGERGYSNG